MILIKIKLPEYQRLINAVIFIRYFHFRNSIDSHINNFTALMAYTPEKNIQNPKLMIKQHVAYFVNDLYIAEYCCSEIRKVNKGIAIRKYNGFEEYFNQIILSYSAIPFVDVTFQYFKLHNFIKQLIQHKKVLDIIINKHIASVKIVVTPSNLLPVFKDLNNPEVVRYYLRGRDLKFASKNVYEKLNGQALLLYKLRSIYIKKRHLNLKEFLDQITQNLLLQFNGAFPKLKLWEKKGGKEVYKTIDDSVLQSNILENEILQYKKIKAINIEEISDEDVKYKLKSLNIKHHLVLPVHSKHVSGYLSFFSKLDRIDAGELEILKLILNHIFLAIDNTYFFNKLIDSECSLHSIFEDSDDGIIVVGPDRKLLDINDAAQQFTGWDKKDAIGKYCKDLYQSRLPNGLSMCNSTRCPMLSPLLEQKTVSIPRILTRAKSGKQKIVQSKYLYERETAGDVVYGIAVVRDITKKVQLEQKLQNFERLSALGKFAAELTHEIRNPITGISSNAQFLFEEKKISENHRMIAREILRGADMVEKTVQKMLDIANPVDPVFCKEDINILISDTLNLLKKKIENSGVELKLALSENIPSIYVDGNLINQVLLNIFINSIESMKNGGLLSVKTQVTRINQSKSKNQQYVRVSISDTGCGISADNLEKIFDPFFTTKKEGSGLGLYTSYRILRDHDASITVKSTENAGTQTCINFKISRKNMNVK